MSQISYRNDLIKYQIDKRFPGQSKETVAVAAKRAKVPVCAQTVGRIVAGDNVSVNKLKAFTDFLGVKWEHVFNPRLTERQFHRAVCVNGDRGVR